MNNEITFREAAKPDLEQIVEMLSDDVLGSKRERFELPLPLHLIEETVNFLLLS